VRITADGQTIALPPPKTILAMSSNAAEVFVYTGPLGERVPRDVVRVRVDPSVTSIPSRAFARCNKLVEVELCEGLVEIGYNSFAECDYSITKINIPNSLRRIKDWAFISSLRTHICLHDDIESIGEGAFDSCIFTNFRVPSLITMIPSGMLYSCYSLFSLELSENARQIGTYAFSYCFCLRNVAFPPNAELVDDIFFETGTRNSYTDLQHLFGSNASIIWGLQHRFDRLPIHRLVYYQSYNQGVLQHLISAINMTLGHCSALCSKLDPTGNEQDCLGMTPLHILACSSVHDLELYRVIVDNYPINLITEDRWGALPLLYAFWGAAPTEIIQFLLDSYQLHYPGHIFNWTMMAKTIGRTDTPKESIDNLLCVKQMHYPEQPIDWDHLLDVIAASYRFNTPASFQDIMPYLVMCSMSDCVDALAFKVWRDYIKRMDYSAEFIHNGDNMHIVRRIQACIQSKVVYFEAKYYELKEITTTLELALWKLRMNEKIPPEETTPRQKKIKTDESNIRQQCRITCGADVIIRHVLQYLIYTEEDGRRRLI
jgi:hypothetical protein